MDKTRLKKLIGPLILEQLFAVSVGVIDTLMVSKVGEAAVSGVALVDTLNILIIQIMAAFAAGGIVVISQHIGNNNKEMVFSACKHLEILVNTFSIIVMAICVVFGRFILKGLYGSIEPEVMTAARTYLLVTGISFVFWGMYTVGAAQLRCHEDTKTSMKVSLIMNLINVVLNAFFVFVLHMGVLGVAIATLISRAIAGIRMKLTMISPKNPNRVVGKLDKVSWDMLKSILAMGVPSGIENGMFHVGKLTVARMVATLGTFAIAANSIAYQIIEFPNIPGNTIGLAMTVIIGQDIGAGNKELAVSDAKHMMKYAYICDSICKAILFVVAPFLVGMFSLSPAATESAVTVLRWFSVIAVFAWPLSFTMPNALRGAGDVKYAMIVSVVSMWLGRVLVSYILVMHFNMGILGVWLGMFVDFYIRGAGYLYRFLSKKWLEKRIV